MTVLDDDRLSALVTSAGDAFALPAHGIDDIMARAESGADAVGDAGRGAGGSGSDALPAHRAGRSRRLAALAARHRVRSVAACVLVLVVVAGVLGALVARPTPRTATSGLARLPRTALPTPATTTTIPASAGAHRPTAGAGAGVFGPGLAQGASGRAGAGASSTTTPTTAPTLPSGAVGQSARIEQTGALGLRVGRGRLGRTMTELAAVATANGGFVANSQTQSGSGPPTGSITLQVPVGAFGAALAQAQALGKTSALSTRATDVTGQYVDLQARLAALEASRQQYLTIMARATTVGDVLAVQAQLDTIESQIEQLQGQLQLLTAVTASSTLTVSVHEGTPAPVPGPRPASGLARAWHDSVDGFVAGMEGALRVAGPLLFALLCLGALAVGGRALWRRWQRHRL